MTPLKRKSLRAVFHILLVISVPASVLFAGYLALPRYIESRLIPKLIEKTGIARSECHIRRIGFTGAEAGPIRIGDRKKPALLIHSLQIDYTLKEIIKKQIRCVRMAGVTLNCGFQDGRLTLPGIDLSAILGTPAQAQAQASDAQPTRPEKSHKMMPGRIELRCGILAFTFNQTQYRIPFELTVRPKTDRLLQGMLWLYPRGQKLVAAADVSLEPNNATITLTADAVDLARFADLTALVPGLGLSGKVDIRADAGIRLSPFSIDVVHGDLDWKNARIDYPPLRFTSPDTLDQSQKAIKIIIRRDPKGTFHVSSPAFSIAAPFPAGLSSFQLDIQTDQERTQATGRVNLRLKNHPLTPDASIALERDHDMTVRFSAGTENNGRWHAELSNNTLKASAGKKKKLLLKANGIRIACEAPVISAVAEGRGLEGTARIKATAGNALLTDGNAEIRISALHARGEVKIDQEHLDMDFQMNLPDIQAAFDSMTMNLPRLSFSGHVRKPIDRPPVFNGIFKFKKMSLSDRASGLKLEGAGCRMPLVWPADTPGAEGSFSARRIWLNDLHLGTLSGTVRQREMGAVFSGIHENRLIPGLKALFAGEVKMPPHGGPSAHIEFQIPELNLTPGADLGRFSPKADGITFDGVIGAKGAVTFKNAQLDSSAAASIDRGILNMSEPGIVIEGIRTKLRFTDLINFRSGPDQQLRFEKATLGTIAIDGGTIHFQVESADAFFIEKSSFTWCNGTIDSQSLRILPDSDDYRLTLFCSRLDLAMMLNQVGGIDAMGKGTVNGKIPLEVRAGNIKITDGFLNSVPGDEGRIQIRGAEMLTQGLSMGNAQLGQLELAVEALKDYKYEWAKLSLNSEADTLSMRLQLDGKPAKPLPFEFKQDLGGFARVASGKTGSLFQGISLDVNLKLPLNEILRYKDTFDKMQ